MSEAPVAGATPLEQFRFTFLHGVRVRSGTNYLAKIMSCVPDIQQVPLRKTTDEFPLLRVLGSWERAFADFCSRFNGDRAALRFPEFLPHLGAAWRRYLIDTFALQPGHVFVKDPSVQNVDRFFDIFPDAKLIFLVRDGRDSVASSMKAALAIRSSESVIKRTRRRLSHLLQRDLISAAREWASAVDTIRGFDEEFRSTPLASRYMSVRYEDVFENPREMAARLFTFMGVPFDEATLESVANADVVGSSFYGKTGREDAKKPNWTATPKTEAFKPVGRWNQWSPRQKAAFRRIAGRQLIEMGYERDLNWR